MTSFSLVDFKTDEHYDEVCRWWREHSNWDEPIPKEVLAPDGLVIPGVCAGWIYHSEVAFSYMEWLVANPDQPGKVVYKGLRLLVDALKEKAYDKGKSMIYTSVKHEGLIRLYKKCGFIEGDTGMTNMICLGGQ